MEFLSMRNVNTDCCYCVSNIAFNTQEFSLRMPK